MTHEISSHHIWQRYAYRNKNHLLQKYLKNRRRVQPRNSCCRLLGNWVVIMNRRCINALDEWMNELMNGWMTTALQKTSNLLTACSSDHFHYSLLPLSACPPGPPIPVFQTPPWTSPVRRTALARGNSEDWTVPQRCSAAGYQSAGRDVPTDPSDTTKHLASTC